MVTICRYYSTVLTADVLSVGGGRSCGCRRSVAAVSPILECTFLAFVVVVCVLCFPITTASAAAAALD